ncbi:hypothetical protein BDN72DRAFT_770304 [Pluteus cervinus]|uniref:Uncharacterized protein n=1 Tax=Pluteus cervinus TaxID=181527 RepID=A0ACD3AQ39_9AGAR|nr:hypothetical protein BDN72DRAFT_770304 [Pluteus cervinus]
MDDVFTDNSPVIVDCDLLEAAKENVQPLGTGRRVTALSAILATPHAQRESKLAATRNRLRINVEMAMEDDEDDPLEAYCRLVYWTVENYPQGHSAESGLLELLEEATRVLKDHRDGHWRQELKYLKLWLLYASYVEKPTIIYRFLIANEIGTSHALLYEEYAAVLERDGRRKEADDAYVLGIARRATPLDHLQSRHSDFQKRMMCSTASPAPAAAPSTGRADRPVLAPSRTSGSGTTPTSSSSRSSSSRPLSSAIPSSSSNAPLQIFVDPTGTASESAEGGENSWTDLGTRKSRIKENVPEVKKLAGTTLKQAGRSKRVVSGSGAAGASRSVSGSKIVPFRDPGPEDMLPPTSPEISSGSSSSKGTIAATTTKKKAPSSLKFSPFVDTKETTTPAVPATPKFTPFRDEASTGSSPTSSSSSGSNATTGGGAVTPIPPESVMKVKKAGLSAPTSEAEALRKDPLKNYGSDVRVEVDG